MNPKKAIVSWNLEEARDLATLMNDILRDDDNRAPRWSIARKLQECGFGKVEEFCICAAVKSECGRVIRCHRHCDGIAAIGHRGLKLLKEQGSQGFITSKNRFVGRQEGYQLQIAAGIASISPDGYRGTQLFSEDLY